jgi:hypothetical protein
MSPLEVRLLNSLTSFLGHLDDIINDHPVYVTIGIFYLLMLLAIFLIIRGIRRRAKGLINPGPRVIYIESAAPPPPPPEPSFDPFPVWRECDCDHDRDD